MHTRFYKAALILLAALLLLSAGLTVFLYVSLRNQVSQEFLQLREGLSTLNANLSSLRDPYTSSLAPAGFREESQIYSDFSLSILSPPKDGQANVLLQARPKSIRQSDHLYFTWAGSTPMKPQKIEAFTQDGITYACRANLPVSSPISLYISLEQDGQVTNEMVPFSSSTLLSELSGSLAAYADFRSVSIGEGCLRFTGDISLQDYRREYSLYPSSFKSSDVVVRLNGKEVERFPMALQKGRDHSDACLGISFENQEWEAHPGALLEFYFEAEDEYGLHYSQMIESYMVPSHGASEDSVDSLIPYAYAGYMEVT